MKKNVIKVSFILIVLVACLSSCKKYLDAKSNQRLATPSSLTDLQSILDYVLANNRGTTFSNIAADEYYVTSDVYNSLPLEEEKKGYIWDIQTDDYTDWAEQYNIVFQANTVLENLEDLKNANQVEKWNNIKGSALFFRAHSFYQIAQLYAKQYTTTSAATTLGIPLRLSSDFNQLSVRATIAETYDQILSDINESINLLPDNPPFKTRPGKPAAFGLLARVYLTMGDYDKSLQYADSCLLRSNTLLDYNSFDPGLNDPLQRFNDEVIFYSNITCPSPMYNFWAQVDSNLYNSYDNVDLRKSIFFQMNPDNTYAIKTSYNGAWYEFFTGIAVDEIYLIRAECNARLGNKDLALEDLNKLLVRRYEAGTYTDFTAATSVEALAKILEERKKELIFRGLRWIDIRRLNSDGYNIEIKRLLDGQTYILSPNDLRSTFLIPRQVIRLSGVQQNER